MVVLGLLALQVDLPDTVLGIPGLLVHRDLLGLRVLLGPLGHRDLLDLPVFLGNLMFLRDQKLYCFVKTVTFIPGKR